MDFKIEDEKIILKNSIFNVIYRKTKSKKSEVFYSCIRCVELFSSKHGAITHVCKNGYEIQNFDIVSIPPISASEPTPRKNVADYGLVVEQLIRFVCTSNIHLHAMDNEYFRQALYIINPEFDFPLRETMAKRIIEFADELKNKTYTKF